MKPREAAVLVLVKSAVSYGVSSIWWKYIWSNPEPAATMHERIMMGGNLAHHA